MTSSVGSHMKRALVASSLVLVMGGALVGCGSDSSDSSSDSTSASASASDSAGESAGTSDGASASASSTQDDTTATFCQAFVDFGTALGTVDPSAAPADIISEIKSEADKLNDVDLPDGIPSDAEDGFNAIIGAIDDLPDDATLEDLGNLESGLSADEKANAKTFNTYLETTCPQLNSGAATADPSASAPAASESPS